MKKGSGHVVLLRVILIFLFTAVATFALEKTALIEPNESSTIVVDISQSPTEGASTDEEITETSAEASTSEFSEPLEELLPQIVPEEVSLQLATLVNGRSIDDPYIQEYLRLRNNFLGKSYRTVTDSASETFREGHNVPEDVKGFALDNQLYYVHLIICDEEFNACYFRINGVPTGKFATKDNELKGKHMKDAIQSFDLNENYIIEINEIRFNDCGEQRFCDIYWDKKDIVNLAVRRK